MNLVEAYFACKEDPYNQANNPNGYLEFGVAINHCGAKNFLPLFPGYIEEDDMHYNHTHGMDCFRKHLASLDESFSDAQLCASTSLAATIDNLVHAQDSLTKKIAVVTENEILHQDFLDMLARFNRCDNNAHYLLTECLSIRDLPNLVWIIQAAESSSEQYVKVINGLIQKKCHVVFTPNNLQQLSELPRSEFLHLALPLQSIDETLSFGLLVTHNNDVFECVKSQNHNCCLGTLPQKHIVANNITFELDNSFYCGLLPADVNQSSFKKETVKMLQHFFHESFDEQYLMPLCGVGASIEFLTMALLEKGDEIMISAPYYAGFDLDVERPGFINVPVSSNNDIATANDYRRVYGQHKNIKAIILCTPNNPTGQVYSQQHLQDIVDFALEKNIHLICDEIYANTIFSDKKFSSCLKFINNPNIHWCYGIAKDMAVSGFKAGFAYSKNKKVLDYYKKYQAIYKIPGMTQHVLSVLFHTPKNIATTLEHNKQLLAEAYKVTTQTLKEHHIPYVEVQAGILMWIDLRAYLSEPTFEAENALFNKFMQEGRICISPGELFHADEPGWFRLCFARDIPEVKEALQRIVKTINMVVTIH